MNMIYVHVYIDGVLQFQRTQPGIPEVHGNVPVTVTVDDTEYQIAKVNWVYAHGVLRHVAVHLTDLPLADRAVKALEDAGFQRTEDFTCWESAKGRGTLLTLDAVGPASTRLNVASGLIETLAAAGLGVAMDGSTHNLPDNLAIGRIVQVYKLPQDAAPSTTDASNLQ